LKIIKLADAGVANDPFLFVQNKIEVCIHIFFSQGKNMSNNVKILCPAGNRQVNMHIGECLRKHLKKLLIKFFFVFS
jgi:hypothetical protein